MCSNIEINLQDIDAYRTAVENLAINKSEIIFPNESEFHAAIVIGKIMKYATKFVRIYDGDLTGDITDRPRTGFSDDFDYFEKSNCKLKILLKEETINNDNWFYQRLQEINKKSDDRVEIKVLQADDNNLELVKSFTVGDSESFRLELLDTDLKDINNDGNTKKSRQAFCSFNQKALASTLVDMFDKSFKLGESISSKI